MDLSLNGLSALRVLREVRSKKIVLQGRRVSLRSPNPGERGRWSKGAIAQHVSEFASISSFSREQPLCVAVPSKDERLRVVGTRSTIYSQGLPQESFIEIGDGLCICCPELLFIEMGKIMSPVVHLLFGMELCGTFSRDAFRPRGGEVTYGIPPVTTVERIRAFVDDCHDIDGTTRARETLEWLLDNAWSPMEAIIAALSVLPMNELGYDLWPLRLNQRLDTEEGATASSRVPDLRFIGTDVGINYDGEKHLPIKEIVDAALLVAQNPGDKDLNDELEHAVEEARKRSVGDKRRDRELGAVGMHVMSLTKEDLYEYGGLDRAMLQVISAIEREGKRTLSRQRQVLQNPLLARFRQDLIWSLLPGKNGIEASRRLEAALVPNPHPTVREYVIEGGKQTLVDEYVL